MTCYSNVQERAFIRAAQKFVNFDVCGKFIYYLIMRRDLSYRIIRIYKFLGGTSILETYIKV